MAHRQRVSKQAPALDGVPMGDLLRVLAARGEPRFYDSGRLLIEEGDTGSMIFIVLSGRLRAFSTNAEHTRRMTYSEALPGGFIGEMSLDGAPRSASVEAVEPSWCVPITRVLLEQHIALHPAFAFELLAKVIQRARLATLSLRDVAFNDVYGRVVGLLNARATPGEAGERQVGPITQQEMADVLGCTRPMISRVMKELLKGGYVAVGARTFTLMKPLPARY